MKKAEQVIFKIDGELSATERQPFYDLRGTRQEDGLAQGLDLSDIGAGEHTVTAEVTSTSGETRTCRSAGSWWMRIAARAQAAGLRAVETTK